MSQWSVQVIVSGGQDEGDHVVSVRGDLTRDQAHALGSELGEMLESIVFDDIEEES